MQKANLDYVLAAAGDDRHTDRFAKAVRASIEVGVVVPSILRTKLADAGFELVDDTAALSEYGFASLGVLKRVLIRNRKGEIVAMGAAGDRDEAILHAALGWFREHPLEGAAVPEGLTVAPAQPRAKIG